MAAGTSGAVPGGGGLLQCADDRSQGLAAWQVGGSHNQTLTTPTLWQYPGESATFSYSVFNRFLLAGVFFFAVARQYF